MSEPQLASSASAERGQGRRRLARPGPWAGLAALLLLLAACGWFDPPIEPDPPADELFQITSAQSVAAGQVVVAHGAGTRVVLVKALVADMAVSAATSGTSTVVAWVGGSPRAGDQVQIGFVYPAGATQPVVANAKAFASSDGPDLGAGLALVPTEATARDREPLEVAGYDHAQDDPSALSAEFANYRLGDVNADGVVNALDALKIRELADAGGGSAHEVYHSDLDGDYDTDAADVQRTLDKAVDPELAPLMQVKPARLTFVQLDPDVNGPALVLVANGGNQPLAGLSWSDVALSVSEVGGIAGQSAALGLGAPPDRDWLPEVLTVSDASGASASVRLGNLVILIAGQSNASGRGALVTGWPEEPHAGVRLLGNDYKWRNAQEPLDYAANQLDMVSYDGSPAYSFGTRLGNLLHDSLGFRTYLIPSALGGSPLVSWRPNGVTNRDTLFGSANYRALVSAGRAVNPATNDFPAEGGPVNVIVWHQGESENLASERANFVAYTNQVMNTFEAQLGAPVVYAQLGSHYSATRSDSEQLNVQYHAIAELQRRMEREGLNMVVTYDLPRSDRHHLSAYGQRVFAERLELAIRQHVFGEDVDGTGPRLRSAAYVGNTVTLGVDRPLQAGALDKTYFTVWDGAPVGSLDDLQGSYYQNTVAVSSVEVPSGAPDTVVITLSGAVTSTPYVRYMVPHGVPPGTEEPSQPSVWETLHTGVARSSENALPLPVFGPLAASN